MHYNLGMAYAALHDYEDAVAELRGRRCPTRSTIPPYKAYTGMGNALLKMGKTAEAGVAFRNAALDEATRSCAGRFLASLRSTSGSSS